MCIQTNHLLSRKGLSRVWFGVYCEDDYFDLHDIFKCGFHDTVSYIDNTHAAWRREDLELLLEGFYDCYTK